MNITKTNPKNEDIINQTAAFANMLSGACASPVVNKTVDICNSFAPVVAFNTAIQALYELEAYPVAFDLILAWLNTAGRTVPEVLSVIAPDSALAEAFVYEFLLDLEDIIDQELDDNEYDEDDCEDEEDDEMFGDL